MRRWVKVLLFHQKLYLVWNYYSIKFWLSNNEQQQIINKTQPNEEQLLHDCYKRYILVGPKWSLRGIYCVWRIINFDNWQFNKGGTTHSTFFKLYFGDGEWMLVPSSSSLKKIYCALMYRSMQSFCGLLQFPCWQDLWPSWTSTPRSYWRSSKRREGQPKQKLPRSWSFLIRYDVYN